MDYTKRGYIPYNGKKMVPGLARIMERATSLSIFSHNLWIFEQCKKTEDDCIANRSFTS